MSSACDSSEAPLSRFWRRWGS